MRFFQYKATDSSGRMAEGTIRAASADAASAALTQAGYRVIGVSEAGTPASPAPRAPAPRPAPQAVPTPTPIPGPRSTSQRAPTPPRPSPMAVAAAPAAVAINVPQVATPPATIKTPFGRDKDLFFMFSQLRQYFHAGIAPQQAFHNLAQRARPRYVESLQDIERNSGEGRRISDIMERYPYLYSPDIVGAVRAGEVAGQMPETFDKLADGLNASARIKRRLSYFFYLLIITLAAVPLLDGIVKGSLHSMEIQDKNGDSLPPVSTAFGAIFRAMGSEVVPTLIMTVLFIAFMLWWHSMPMRRTRHWLVLRLPAMGGRVKAEAMERFTWALEMISRGGVLPQTAFTMAAHCVPNDILREHLIESGKTMHEAERLSSAIKRSNTMPQEFVYIVETGELTGDVPRALDDVHRATDNDFRAREGTAVTTSSTLFYIGIGVFVLGIMFMMYQKLYLGIFKVFENDAGMLTLFR